MIDELESHENIISYEIKSHNITQIGDKILLTFIVEVQKHNP